MKTKALRSKKPLADVDTTLSRVKDLQFAVEELTLLVEELLEAQTKEPRIIFIQAPQYIPPVYISRPIPMPYFPNFPLYANSIGDSNIQLCSASAGSIGVGTSDSDFGV